TQVDLPSDRVSGLIEARDILHEIPGIQFVYFDQRDVVRHRLVQEIIEAYDRHSPIRHGGGRDDKSGRGAGHRGYPQGRRQGRTGNGEQPH
ncbi:MAG: PhoH family protein, partial [Nitrospirota bacterium]|nr:PhoH family protein [Nitrospirota bacterium]